MRRGRDGVVVVVASGGCAGAMSGPRGGPSVGQVGVLGQTSRYVSPAHPLSVATSLCCDPASPVFIVAPTVTATGPPLADGAVRAGAGAVVSWPAKQNAVIASAGPGRTPPVPRSDLGLDGGENVDLLCGLGLGLGLGLGQGMGSPCVELPLAPGVPHGDGNDGPGLAGGVLEVGTGEIVAPGMYSGVPGMLSVGDVSADDNVGVAYRPFCETVFRDMFSQKFGYVKSGRLSCLCSWCE